ncbi:MAG: hypothetical protein KAG20_09360, partial [Cocleimonas sp.]|nr:hypothetical protein [Cocleimonas sp.]
PNFQKERDEQTERDQQRVWKGTLKGVEITLHSAVTAKAHQEGGWDLLKNRPKPLRSYIPAGSAFYCSSEADPQTIITALHYQQIGTEQKLGRGKIAIGQWI